MHSQSIVLIGTMFFCRIITDGRLSFFSRVDQRIDSLLITTKLYVPKYGSDLLRRQQPVDQIDVAATARLILVCAAIAKNTTLRCSESVCSRYVL